MEEEEDASITSSMLLAEEEEEFKRWQRQVEPWQWQPGSVVAGGAPNRLLSEEDLKPGKVEFESMEAARDGIKKFCWCTTFLCPPVRPQTVYS
jgi:hypothetical protein